MISIVVVNRSWYRSARSAFKFQYDIDVLQQRQFVHVINRKHISLSENIAR